MSKGVLWITECTSTEHEGVNVLSLTAYVLAVDAEALEPDTFASHLVLELEG